MQNKFCIINANSVAFLFGGYSKEYVQIGFHYLPYGYLVTLHAQHFMLDGRGLSLNVGSFGGQHIFRIPLIQH